MNEHVDPIIVADATIGQLSSYELPIERRYTWHGLWDSLPPWKAVDEASERQAGRIADDRGKRSGKGHGPENQPTSSQVLPFLCHRLQPCKYSLAEDKEQYGKGNRGKASNDGQGQLDASHPLYHLEHSAP